jgi:hypothetical protein
MSDNQSLALYQSRKTRLAPASHLTHNTHYANIYFFAGGVSLMAE